MQHEDQPGAQPAGPEADVKLARRAKSVDSEPRLLTAARIARGLLPGDSRLGGDPLSTGGDETSSVLARRLAALGDERPSVTRELGFGALQVWQALSEAQGRGRGSREVTILFTDLVDFSSWALTAGDDAALALVREVAQATEPAIEARGGQVVKRLGDGLMAAFADPAQAVVAAHEACARVAALQVEGHRPGLRAGVHAGHPRRIGGDYVGVDVNVAARVADAARGGEVLASGAVGSRLDPHAFRVRRRRRFRAKGTPRNLEVYAVELIEPSETAS